MARKRKRPVDMPPLRKSFPKSHRKLMSDGNQQGFRRLERQRKAAK